MKRGQRTGSPMRILMTIDAEGGVFTYALELASGLVARGVKVVFASMGRALTGAQRLGLEERGVQLEESDFRLEWMDDPWPDVEQAGRWLLSLEAKHQPDVVHLNGFAHGSLAFRAPTVVVAHSSVLSWWRAVFGEDAPSSFDRYRAEVTKGLRGATRIVAPTRAMLDMLCGHEPWLQRELARNGINAPGGRAVVIENGISEQHFAEASKEPFVFSASRVWDRAKNVALLAELAPRVAWPIRVAGDRGNERADSLQGLELLGSLGRERLAPLMQAASIYASPALYEPFGLSILEAAARGAALVLGDIPSLRELWTGTAVFADPRDESSWVTKINQLISDEPLRLRFALGARARARRYGIERMADAYLELYRGLATRRSMREARALGVTP